MSVRLSGLISNMDTDSIVQELMSAQSMKKTKIENKKTKLEWKQEKWKALNTKIYALYTGTLSKMRFQANYSTKKVTSTNNTALSATVSSTAANGAHKLNITQLASSQYVTSGTLSLDASATATSITSDTTLKDLGVASGTVISIKDKDSKVIGSLSVSTTTTIEDFVDACDDAGLNASFDEDQGRFYLSSEKSGEDNSFSISVMNGTTDYSDKLGLGSSATNVAATNAKFELDGVDYEETSNKVTINGLTLELQDTTGTEADPDYITLTVANDSDAAYTLVKEFLTEYNALLEEMNDDYYASSAKGYDPLTDDEKEAMSDDEIEKWETKIKDSLLRRDDKLGSLLSTMKTTLASPVKVDGKNYSLSSFGISSALYTEKGKLHINGDPDDTLVADQTDKLKAALEDDPDTVMKVLTTVCGNLYSTMQEKMKSTTLNSALTFYNDKEMNNQIEDYEDEIDDMEDKLADLEDRYYAQFTAMETAMANLNSQQSALSSMIS